MIILTSVLTEKGYLIKKSSTEGLRNNTPRFSKEPPRVNCFASDLEAMEYIRKNENLLNRNGVYTFEFRTMCISKAKGLNFFLNEHLTEEE